MTDLTELSALDLALLVRARQLSSREIIEAFLSTIERRNPSINAVTLTLAEDALAAADAADASAPLGPLHGVPFSVKENIDLVGTPTTSGLAAFVDEFPTGDAPIVERMKAAGGIPIARTNLPELGLRADTDNPLRGRTANPWNLERSPGGSSGGEAAAIASRMSPLGLGNDIGGSLRSPAFCCGVVGFRPTMGRVPSFTTLEPAESPLSGQLMSTEGALGSTVADVRLATTLLDGADRRDPFSVDVDFERLEPLARVAGVVTAGIDGPLDPAVATGVQRAADALADAGWEIRHIELPENELVLEIWMRIMAEDIPALLDALGPLITPRLAEVLMDHTTVYDPARIPHTAIFSERERLMRRWTAMFAETPVVIGPVMPEQAFVGGDDMRLGIDYVCRLLHYVQPAPLLGLPALAVPTGVVNDLPVGVQIHADRWNDAWCFEAGADIEAAIGTIRPAPKPEPNQPDTTRGEP